MADFAEQNFRFYGQGVRAIHIATNFLDNPILTQAEHALEKVGAIAGGIGLVLGALLAWFFGRKKKV